MRETARRMQMDVKEAIETRRAYRSLEAFAVTDEVVRKLAEAASLAPSCFNKQPWRFVFVSDPGVLKELHAALAEGNKWAFKAPLIVAAFSRKELDCIVKGREYFLFDLGAAVGFLILRATELGLVAHPIAGFDEEKAKETLGIPREMTLTALIVVGKHAPEPAPELSEAQASAEKARPERRRFEEFVHLDRFRERRRT